MLMLLAPFLGILGSAIPALLGFFQKKEDNSHELRMAEFKSKQIEQQGKIDVAVTNINADSIEGKSLRDHDAALDGGKFINALRAFVRPFITYTFFFLFCAVKIAAAYVMISNGQ